MNYENKEVCPLLKKEKKTEEVWCSCCICSTPALWLMCTPCTTPWSGIPWHQQKNVFSHQIHFTLTAMGCVPAPLCGSHTTSLTREVLQQRFPCCLYVFKLYECSIWGACNPYCNTTQLNPWVHNKWSVVTHYFSLFTVSTMDTCAAARPVKGPFLSIICCALEPHQLTLVMSCAQ